MTPYELGYKLGKAAQAMLPLQTGMSIGGLGNPPGLPAQNQARPMAQLPGSRPVSPLSAGMAQPAVPPAPMAGAGNQVAPAGGGPALQQVPQVAGTSISQKRATDYQVPGRVGSFGSSSFSPEALGQRDAVSPDTGELAIAKVPKPRNQAPKRETAQPKQQI